jgi:alkanesulfonate monooxygenase SsuD/methylene tetrahydromethanopterin reductase-like flavin-dependent oxidoreductase (luciferase family)
MFRQPGFALRDPLPWADLVGIVAQAEALGYGAVFLPEIAGRDAVATLSALAGETRHLLLGTGVLPMGSRTPMLTAMGAATVHERSQGRFVLGIGAGPATAGALDRLRELVQALRRLLAGETVELDGRRLWLSLQLRSPVPIWISALGPKAVRLAGEVADGVLLNWCTPERVSSAREQLAEGAAASGRDPSGVTVAVYVRACFDDENEAAALEALRTATGEYASFPAYARQFAALGFGPEVEAAAKAHAAGRPQEVPEDLVRAICLTGDLEVARARLREFGDAGADLPILYPVMAAGAEPARSILATLNAIAPASFAPEHPAPPEHPAAPEHPSA